MKKVIPIILAILLALSMGAFLTACGGNEEEAGPACWACDLLDEGAYCDLCDPAPAASPTDSEETTNEAYTTEEDENDNENEDLNDEITEPEEDENDNENDAIEETTEPANRYAPPENLNTLSRQEQLDYFNLVANRVRRERPGFTSEIIARIETLRFTGIAAVLNPIIQPIVNILMPGDPEIEVIPRGANNEGPFLHFYSPIHIRGSDIASIQSVRAGDNWHMRVSIIAETNPASGTGSANARAYFILTRQELLDEILAVNDSIQADPNDATLYYHNGFVVLTVNQDGQVIATEVGYDVNAQANNVRYGPLSTNITAFQTTRARYTDFRW